MRLETPFVVDRDLIIVEALLTGPRCTATGRFVLDSGAVFTTITPELADTIGYSARDGIRRTRVHTAIGAENGYLLRVDTFSVLGVTMPSFPLQVFDLGHDGFDGLIGMNFLSELNFEVRPDERRILVEKLAR
jgi:predicted aspartyl protease